GAHRALHSFPTRRSSDLAVLLVALVAFFVFREQVKRRLWVAIGCVLVGLALVAQIWASELNPLGVLFAFLAATMLTIYFVIGERSEEHTSELQSRENLVC